MDNIQDECSVRFPHSFHAHCAQMQRFNQNLVVISTRTIHEVASTNFTLHLDARAVERIRVWVLIFILGLHRSQNEKGMSPAWNACYLWCRNQTSVLKRLSVFLCIIERLLKAINKFYEKIYFIDQNDAFKMQNKINILVENGHFLESQFWVSFQISQKATMIFENYFHDLLVYIQNFIFTNFCHKEMSQIGYIQLFMNFSETA